MIKALSFFKRKPGMDVASFEDYWLNRHAELVWRLPGLKRYTQSHPLRGIDLIGEPVNDGVSELWFDTLADIQALPGTTAHEALLADEEQFIDQDSLGTILVKEYILKQGNQLPAEYIKGIGLLTAKPGMPIDEFQRYWREQHGPLAAQGQGLLRYVQNHTQIGGWRPARDATEMAWGAPVVWYESIDAMIESVGAEIFACIQADEANFLKPGPLPVVVTREHNIMG